MLGENQPPQPLPQTWSKWTLAAFLLLLLHYLQESVDSFLHLLLVRSGLHVVVIVRVRGRLSLRWVWTILLSVTKTCVHHDILVYLGISQVVFKYETLKQVRLGYLCISQIDKRITQLSQHVTYPWISL